MRYALFAVGMTCTALFGSNPHRLDAYIDPGAGHLLLQILAGMAVGSLFYVKKFTHFVKSRFKRTKSETLPRAKDDDKKAAA